MSSLLEHRKLTPYTSQAHSMTNKPPNFDFSSFNRSLLQAERILEERPVKELREQNQLLSEQVKSLEGELEKMHLFATETLNLVLFLEVQSGLAANHSRVQVLEQAESSARAMLSPLFPQEVVQDLLNRILAGVQARLDVLLGAREDEPPKLQN